MKFEFCMLKNTTQADFQLKISTPGIVAANRSSRKKFSKYNTGVNGFQKFLCLVDVYETSLNESTGQDREFWHSYPKLNLKIC